MSKPEVWLRGPIEGVSPLLQPVAHSLLQCGEEVDALLTPLSAALIWQTRGGSASIGFHIRHALGSLDRLYTYARGAALSEAQLQVLKLESVPDPDLAADELSVGFTAGIERALDQLRGTDPGTLTAARFVGRGRLPSTTIGLLFHGAEHTQRHIGQAVTVRNLLEHGL